MADNTEEKKVDEVMAPAADEQNEEVRITSDVVDVSCVAES